MKKLIFTLILISLVALHITYGAAGNLRRFFNNPSNQDQTTVTFKQVISAHCSNGLPISAVTGFRARFMKVTHVTPTKSFQRYVQVEVAPNGFYRSTSEDLFGTRVREERYDGLNYTHRLITKTESSESITDLPEDDSLAATTAAVQTCGLVSMLLSWSQPNVSTDLVENTTDRYTFRVLTANGKWLVSTDKSFLVRRVQSNSVVFEFDDYHNAGVQLPYTQRISVGNVQIENNFYAIELILDPNRSTNVSSDQH